jgi:hypothetical protein
MDGTCSKGNTKNAYKILVGNFMGRGHFGNIDVNGIIIIICKNVNWIELNQVRVYWQAVLKTDFYSCNRREYLVQVNNHHLFKEGFLYNISVFFPQTTGKYCIEISLK